MIINQRDRVKIIMHYINVIYSVVLLFFGTLVTVFTLGLVDYYPVFTASSLYSGSRNLVDCYPVFTASALGLDDYYPVFTASTLGLFDYFPIGKYQDQEATTRLGTWKVLACETCKTQSK